MDKGEKNGKRLSCICDVLKMLRTDDKDGEGSTAPLQYPPPFYYGAAGPPPPPPGLPPMYYPPSSLYAMWNYSYPYCPPQQPYTTTAAMQHVQSSGDTGNVDVNRNEPCDATCEDAKESREFPEIVDSPCNVEMDDMRDASVTDTSPDSRTNEPRLSLSSLKRDYSSSSSTATTPGSTHHHDNSATSSPRKPLDISNFEQQVMEFTSKRTKMIRNIKARSLNLPTDNSTTGIINY